MSISVTKVITRGATIQFSTLFYDVDENVINPDSATINIAYLDTSYQKQTTSVSMTAPSGDGPWTALWDTRNIGAPQTVYWSIHTGTDDPIPVAVEDGQFALQANAANLASF